MLDAICFDFDGTLVNSMEVAFGAFVRLGPEFGCRPFTRAQLLELRGLHVRDVIRAVGVPLHRVPRLAQRMRRAMRAELMDTPPVAGMPEVLEQLAGRGYRLSVLSSNAESSVREYIDRHALPGLGRVVGDTGLFGKAKALRRLACLEGVSAQRLLYVGDEIRDIEAARRAGVRSGAVGWGYNTLERLAAMDPDDLFEHPDDLLECLPGRPAAPSR